MDEHLLKGHLPALALGLIAERPMHGYALAREINDRAADRLGEGTIYPLLRRLETQGLIKGGWEDGPHGKPRKVYRLTPAGRRQLEAARADWRDLRFLVRRFLGAEWEKA